VAVPAIMAILYNVLLLVAICHVDITRSLLCIHDTQQTYSKQAKGSLLQITTQNNQIYVQQWCINWHVLQCACLDMLHDTPKMSD